MKLSKTQQEAIQLMGDGWELSKSESIWDSKIRLQRGGSGKGGEVKTISIATFFVLLRKGYIEINKRSFPASTYRLKEASNE